MGGYKNVKKSKFIHIDDKCPSNCPSFKDGAICVGYDSIS
jgi:hypothetical protein